MSRGSALLSVAALFLSGVAIGALGMFLIADGRRAEPPRGPRPGPPPRFAMEMMTEALELTPEQREQIEAIHRESRRAAEEIRREMKPRLEAHILQTRQRMMEILTSEQRRRFEQMRVQFGARMDRFFLGEGRGGPPGGPRRRPGARRRESRAPRQPPEPPPGDG